MEGGPRAWTAKVESDLVSPMFKEPCKQKPKISVARARAGLKLGQHHKSDKKAVTCGRQKREGKTEGLDHTGKRL